MAPTKVHDRELREFLEGGGSQGAAARHFGVSPAAISQRVRKMRTLSTHVVALERAGEFVDQKLSASARLEHVQQVIDGELAWAVDQARQQGGDRAALADVILRLAAEVRQQLGLQLNITRALVDLRVVKEFQETVVDIIREEAPQTARRLVERLKERKAMRPSAELPTLDGGGSNGFMV